MILIIKTYIFLLFRILADISFWLLSKFGNMVIQPKFDLLCMLSGPEKKSGELFLFFHFFNKIQEDRKSHVALKSLNCFTDLFQGSNLPWPYAD